MINKLRRRFFIICAVSILPVVAVVFGAIVALNISSLNKNMDVLTDQLAAGGGRFPGSFSEKFKPDKLPPLSERDFDFITPETPFATRHFTVVFDMSGNTVRSFTESIYAITEEQAVEYAEKVLANKRIRGWMSNYRFKAFSTEHGWGVVFVDGSVNRAATMQATIITGGVLFTCTVVVLVLILILSKKAVKPIVEGYEKQKQFITDANHELKTPLTLILANLDIAESELGKNEWLDDIRSEGNRMSELVNQLVALSRTDEEKHTLNIANVTLGRLVSDTVSEFEPLAKSRGKALGSDIDAELVCRGDESLLRRLVGILMDNAIKYCDCGGEIFVSLHRSGRHVVLLVENTYSAVAELELNRLFDRFYRADEARTFKGGYGIGLSMAKAIAEKHKGNITAYKKGDACIGFKVVI